jgi:hypothetical protein
MDDKNLHDQHNAGKGLAQDRDYDQFLQRKAAIAPKFGGLEADEAAA